MMAGLVNFGFSLSDVRDMTERELELWSRSAQMYSDLSKGERE